MKLLLLLLGLLAAAPARAQISLYADPTANRTGDLLTVVLAERTAAERESTWRNQADANIGGDAFGSGGSGLSGRFALDADFNTGARSRNESVQRDLLHGTITARVVDRDAAGNLVIAGERRISVNGETHTMKISGIVRPYDIRYNNTVLSYQIADASVEYRRAGLARRFFRPGWFVRLGLAAVLGAALVYSL